MVNIVYFLLKILTVAILGIYYTIGGTLLSLLFNKVFKDFNKEQYDKKSTIVIFLEIFLSTTLITLGAYLLRHIIKKVKFPYDGIYDFNHRSVREIDGGITITMALIMFMDSYKEKLKYLIKNRLS